jgi:hypothetical protein
MKKGLTGLLALSVLFLACVYIFIPRQLNLSGIAYINCAPEAAYRFLSDEGKWPEWWPGYKSAAAPGRSFTYMGDEYRITKKMYNRLDIAILHGGEQIDSRINLLPLHADSLILQWQCSLSSGNNPFTRIAQYKKAVDIKKNMSGILQQLDAFLGKKENVYGINIQRTSTSDTMLIATKTLLPAYPSTAAVYRLIDTLKNYISSQGATITGYPIMNVDQQEDRQFRLMVAIPVNHLIPGKGTIFQQKMIPGAFMVADVTGGESSVTRAQYQMRLYFADYKKMAMAIPFAALITDRSKEPDTSRWVTRIYAPVF